MNKPIKLKWKNSDAPTGRFRSFHKRGWPTADIVGTEFFPQLGNDGPAV